MSTPPRDDAGEQNVVPLGAEVVDGHGQEPAPSPPSSRLHGLAITGMALSALVGIGSMLAFVTVRWTGTVARFVVGMIIFSAVGFLACASTAVFTAARDMYAHRPTESAGGES